MTSKEDPQFFNQLDTALEAGRKTHETKKKIIETRLHKDKILSFLTQSFGAEEYYSLENAPTVVNVIGLDNAVKEYTGREINKSPDAFAFADKVLAYVNRKLESFNEAGDVFLLFGCLEARRASERFRKMNESRFGVKEVYPANGFTHNYPDTEKWIDTEIKLQQYCNGAAKLILPEWEKPIDTIYDLLEKEDLVAFTLKAR